LADFYYRTIIDDKCIPILVKYIPLFKSVSIALNLITQQFWKKGNIDEAKKIIISRLENDKIKTLSIRALGYYKDKILFH
jgi:hypothetical protein